MPTVDDQPDPASSHPARLLALAFAMPVLTKLAYKPVGIVCGVIGARVAGKIYKRVWLTVANEEDSPAVMDRESGWAGAIGAAATKALVFGTVKAVVDRAGATAFERVTGRWPGSHQETPKR